MEVRAGEVLELGGEGEEGNDHPFCGDEAFFRPGTPSRFDAEADGEPAGVVDGRLDTLALLRAPRGIVIGYAAYAAYATGSDMIMSGVEVGCNNRSEAVMTCYWVNGTPRIHSRWQLQHHILVSNHTCVALNACSVRNDFLVIPRGSNCA